MTHDGDDRRARLFVAGLARHALQFMFNLVLQQDFGGVPHLLHDKYGGLRLDRLINGRHDA
jgi:hypothetical protein